MARARARRLARGACALLAGLALAEAALAILGLCPPDPPLRPGERVPVRNDGVDEHVGWKMPPDRVFRGRSELDGFDVEYASGSLGFRGPEAGPLRAGAEKIVFLGDSFTFGAGVSEEQTFVRLVEAALPGSRCLNFGMTGFGLDQMWRTLEHYALDTDPDVVVLIFIEDDLDRSLTAYRERGRWMSKPLYELEGERLVRAAGRSGPPGPLRWIQRHSRVVEAFRRVSRRVGARFPVGYRWKLNRAIFRAVRDSARAAGAELLVVHASRRPMPVLAGEFRRMEVELLDLAPDLAANGDAWYFPHDPHWNPQGHRHVAARIARCLVERGLLSGR